MIKKFQCASCKAIVESDIEDSHVICGHCESICQVPNEFGPGVVVADYLITELLGQGGMGNVYLAYEFSLERNVALKILKDEFMANPEHRDEFIYEARSVASLNHPNIMQALKVGEENGIVYFVTEHIEGGTLKDKLKSDGPLSVEELLPITIDVVKALGYAWDLRKLVHRDIKPENIMIAYDGTAKLMDLGLSVREGYDVDEGEQIKGTPQYISPEQVTGGEIDIRTDFYCLGATLYHLVSGQFPFRGSLQDIVKGHLSEEPGSLKKLVPGIDETFAKIIHKLMAKYPEKRYQSADSLLSSLTKLQKTLEDEKHGKKHLKLNNKFETKIKQPSSKHIKAKKKNTSAIAVMAMLGVLVLVFGLIFALGGKNTPDNSSGDQAKTIITYKNKKAASDGPDIKNEPEELVVSPVKETINESTIAVKNKILKPITIPEISGQTVRIELPDKRRVLSLAEVEVYVGGKNIAVGKSASQSSNFKEGEFGTEAAKAVDGNINPEYKGRSITHTNREDNPWWQVDLGQDHKIEKIIIYNKKEGADRLDSFTIKVLDSKGQVAFSRFNNRQSEKISFIHTPKKKDLVTKSVTKVSSETSIEIPKISGQKVRIELPTKGSAKQKLYLAEVEIFSNGKNIALGKPAIQSGDLTESYTAKNAVNGDNTDKGFSESATSVMSSPWWEVDLEEAVNIEKITVYNVSGGNANRLNGFTLKILDSDGKILYLSENTPVKEKATFIQSGL